MSETPTIYNCWPAFLPEGKAGLKIPILTAIENGVPGRVKRIVLGN